MVKTNLNTERIAVLWSELLGLLGENRNRVGVRETPLRIARMYEELFYGYDLKCKPKITTFPNGVDGVTYNQMIIDKGCFYSHCEHHGVPFVGTYWFGYIPNQQGRIIGLSKVARLVNFHGARFQIQERLVKDVIDDVWSALCEGGVEPKGMALVLKANHLCKSMRGVKKEGEMVTIELRGLLKEDSRSRMEFFSFVNRGERNGV